MLAVDFLPLVILNINFAEAQHSGGLSSIRRSLRKFQHRCVAHAGKVVLPSKTKSGPILAL